MGCLDSACWARRIFYHLYSWHRHRNVGRDNFRIKNIKKAELVRESGEVVVGKNEMAELERLRCEQKIQHANRRNIAVPV